MAAIRYIRLLAEPAGEVEWMESGEGAVPARGPLDSLPPLSPGTRVVALVPAGRVLVTRVQLPTRTRNQTLQALPYALEDLVTEPVEALHFALGRRDGSGRWVVAVTSRADLESWLERLGSAGQRPDRMVSEIHLAPGGEEEWSALCLGGEALVRTGPATGFGCERENLDLLLAGALQEISAEERPARIRLLGCTAGPTLTRMASELETEIGEEETPMPFSALTAGGLPGEAIDLLQGEYSRSQSIATMIRAWALPMGLLASLGVVWAAGQYLEYRTHLDRAQALQEEIEQLYRQAFPGEHKVVDVRKQVEPKLAALRKGAGGGGFLPLLGRIAPLLKGAEVSRVNGISYRNGQLDLDLTLRDLPALDSLRDALQQRGLEVEIRSASAGEKSVAARLRLKEGGA